MRTYDPKSADLCNLVDTASKSGKGVFVMHYHCNYCTEADSHPVGILFLGDYDYRGGPYWGIDTFDQAHRHQFLDMISEVGFA